MGVGGWHVLETHDVVRERDIEFHVALVVRGDIETLHQTQIDDRDRRIARIACSTKDRQ